MQPSRTRNCLMNIISKVIFLVLFFISFAYAKVNIVVSVVPQKTFAKAIGGDRVAITTMVKPGNSPHTYEPKPSQMIKISKADIYFSIGVEFEKAWLNKFKNLNKNMKIYDTSKGIKKIPIKQYQNQEKNGDISLDPHIWTSPKNVKIIAKNILNALIHVDFKNRSFYKKNYIKFIATIDKTDKKIRNILKTTPKKSKFMVFHPAWGYFAKEYGLIQIPIEVEGKKPKPRTLKHLLTEAKKDKIKAIFTSPEFSDKMAKQLAKELDINVIKVSPLNPQWSKNLINLAKAIAN